MEAWGIGRLTLAATLTCAALLSPSSAAAATVVNGDFEGGSLSGWQTSQATGFGDWFANEGSNPPISGKDVTGPIPAPPQGNFAAVSDEINPDTVVLYQDIALRPSFDHRLSLWAYYISQDPIALPEPDTLSVDDAVLGSEANQQFRIDVIKPGAPIESIDPADVLRTVFRTRPEDSQEMEPRRLFADLSAFAGQTVRLRIATAAHEETFNAGVDAVAVESAPDGKLPPPKGSGKPGGARGFSFGKVKPNPANGTAILPVKVSGPGRLSAKGAGKSQKLIKPVSAKAAKAGTVKLLLRPTASARGKLELKQRLRVKVAVTYVPSGDSARTATVPVVLKLMARQRR